MQHLDEIHASLDSFITKEHDGFVTLWKAVLYRALLDAKLESNCHELTKKKKKHLKGSNNWMDSEYFEEVCLMACVDPDRIRNSL